MEFPMTQTLNFGLDFDDTFTAAPSLFATFVKTAIHTGHNVYIVTARRDCPENRATVESFLAEYGCQVTSIIYTALRSKLYTVEKRGLKIHIWLDDDPHALVHGH